MNRLWADISGWTDRFDGHAYRHAGHRLIGVKATESTGYVSPKYHEQVQAAHQEGLSVLHYHFAHPGDHPEEQAGYFWGNIAAHYGPHDFACLDIETSSGSVGEDNQWVRAFDRRFGVVARHTLIGYSGSSYLSDHGHGIDLRSGRWWIAEYGPQLHKPSWVKRLWAWQRTDGQVGKGPFACAGIGHCDISLLNAGTYARLLAHR